MCKYHTNCTLCDDVYVCQNPQCVQNGFSPKPNGVPLYYRFPALIGCTAQGDEKCTPKDILFVGINPRISRTNANLHQWLAANPGNFVELARNHYMPQSGFQRYICPNGPEKHYYSHMKIVQNVFGSAANFEDHAAVTEIFLCASDSSRTIYNKVNNGNSCCAETFLCRVIDFVKPKIIIPIGRCVFNFFKNCLDKEIGPKCLRYGGNIIILGITHPNENGMTNQLHEEIIKKCSDLIRGILSGKISESFVYLSDTGAKESFETRKEDKADGIYPDPQYAELIKRCDQEPTNKWCINAEHPLHAYWNRICDQRAVIDLYHGYKENYPKPMDNPNKKYIGRFCLNLPALEQKGYVRKINGCYSVKFRVIGEIVYLYRDQNHKIPVGTI